MSSFVSRLLRTQSSNWAPLPLRLALGSVMVGHGAQKLFGWWGGNGLEATAGFFANTLGFQPGILWASLAAGTEFFGGLAVLLGLATRFASTGIAATMAVATWVAHSDAFFLKNNGMEFSLTLLLVAVALAITGGGALSLDGRLASTSSRT